VDVWPLVLRRHLADQVVDVPPRVRDDDGCVRRPSRDRNRGEPAPCCISDATRLGVRTSLVRVVDDDEVGAATGEARARGDALEGGAVREAPLLLAVEVL